MASSKIDQFADIGVLRYEVPGFAELSLREKLFIYYLSKATAAGQEIIWDQNCRYNLAIKQALTKVYQNYGGDRDCQDFQDLLVYIKRVFTSNGIHHHYSRDKILPSCSQTYLQSVFVSLGLDTKLIPVMCDPSILPKQVETDQSKDLVKSSASNYYDGVTQAEVEEYYAELEKSNDPDQPLSLGLNTQVVKCDGCVEEYVRKVGGMYSEYLEKVVHWLEEALPYSAGDEQRQALELLINFYRSGDLADRDAYTLAWLKDTQSRIDVLNGFVEVYADPLQRKGGREASVKFVDQEANARAETLIAHAQWFEDHAPIDTRFKKAKVTGVHASVMTVAMLGGECFPATYLGQNLPNQSRIRANHGSKSVSHQNIAHAYHQAELDSGYWDEFLWSEEEKQREKTYGYLADSLHTDMHECLGHASGQLLPGISEKSLGIYHSAIEETRADLFALYYMLDDKLVELGLIPSLDLGKAQYSSYIFNGMMGQLKRVTLGETIQEAHMRNRQLIAKWCYEQGKSANIIEKKQADGKTYVVVNDFEALRGLFGQLLGEIQRITSEGDKAAARELVEGYGVQVDQTLHAEVLERFAALGTPAYYAFVNPEYNLVKEGTEVVDVQVRYVDDFLAQVVS